MRCLTTLSCSCLAVAALLATTETPSFAEAVCAPTATATGKTVTLTAGSYHSIHFGYDEDPSQPAAYAVGTQTIIRFEYLATNPSATKLSGHDTQKAWLGNQATGANAQFESTGGIPNADYTKIYVSKAADASPAKAGVFTLELLQWPYPVNLFSGDVGNEGCVPGDGLAAQYKQPAAPVWADASGSALLIPVFGCHYVAKLGVSSPFTMSWVVGTGSSTLNSVNAVGLSAHIQQPITLAPWRDRFYLLCYTGRIVEILPYNNYQVKEIRGVGTGETTAASQVWDNTFTVTTPFWGAGQIATWGNCWLQLWSKATTSGHIVDPDGDNTLYKIQGIAAAADFSIADPQGTLWVAGQGGTSTTLVKFTMTYPDCPAAKGQNYCKWPSITKTQSLDAPTPVPPTPPPPTPVPPPTPAVTCAPVVTDDGASVTSSTTLFNHFSVHFHPTDPTKAWFMAQSEISLFDPSASGAISFAIKVGDGSSYSNTGSPISTGTSYKFATYGGLMKSDASYLYGGDHISCTLFQVTMAGNYPVLPYCGKHGTCGSADGDGPLAELRDPGVPVWANPSETTMHMAMWSQHKLATVGVEPPYSLRVVLGDGSATWADGYGVNAGYRQPSSLAAWKDRVYSAHAPPEQGIYRLMVTYPDAGYRLTTIADTPSGGALTTTNFQFIGLHYQPSAKANWQSLRTWSSACFLHIHQPFSEHGHIVNADEGNMFLLTGFPAAKNINGVILDPLSGKVWSFGDANPVVRGMLRRYTIDMSTCIAYGSHSCAFQTKTQSLDEPTPVPPTPAPTPAPPTPVPSTPAPTPVPPTPAPAEVTTTAAATSATTPSAAAATTTTAASTTTAAITTNAATTTAATTGTSGAASVTSPLSLQAAPSLSTGLSASGSNNHDTGAGPANLENADQGRVAKDDLLPLYIAIAVLILLIFILIGVLIYWKHQKNLALEKAALNEEHDIDAAEREAATSGTVAPKSASGSPPQPAAVDLNLSEASLSVHSVENSPTIPRSIGESENPLTPAAIQFDTTPRQHGLPAMTDLDIGEPQLMEVTSPLELST